MNSVYLMFYHLGVYKCLLQGSQMFVLVFCNQPNKKHALVEVGIYVFWMFLYVYVHEFDVYNMTFWNLVELPQRFKEVHQILCLVVMGNLIWNCWNLLTCVGLWIVCACNVLLQLATKVLNTSPIVPFTSPNCGYKFLINITSSLLCKF